ncbi:MAG TPA: 50S ribosomal protein L25 [Terriglobales bacterium]|jgi:large subunit ribosomal protein L25
MGIETALAAETREERGKGPARRLRGAGRIPATLYGAGQAPVALSLDPAHVGRILRSESGHNTIFNLQVGGGESTAAMLVDWQRDPLKGRLLHVDLKRIALDKAMRVHVPVQVRGEAVGVKLEGGILEVVTREVEIECLPGEIPEHIVVDVSALSIGQNLRVSDLKLEGNRRFLTEPDRVVAHVVAVKAVEEPVAAEAAPTAAEPEVIKKGKAETEEAAGKEGGKEGGKEAKEKKK